MTGFLKQQWEKATHLMVATAIAGAAMACSGGTPTSPSPTSPTPPPTTTTPPPTSGTITAQQKSDMINAYLLGQGPMADTIGTPTCATNMLMGWSESVRNIELVVSANTSEAHRQAIKDTFSQYNEARGGIFSLSERISDTQGDAPVGKVYVRTADDISAECSSQTSAGCTVGRRRVDHASYGAGVIILKSGVYAGAAAHEANHAFIAGCHVKAGTPVASNTIMGTAVMPRLTDWEVSTLREIFEKGLRPGATGDDFVRAGITLNNGTTAQVASLGNNGRGGGLLVTPTAP